MKKEEIEKLEEKYFSGDTNLEEEARLLSEKNHAEAARSLWARFVNQRKKTPPSSLQEDVWASIEMKTKAKRRKLIGGFLAAASVAILMFSTPYLFLKEEMGDAEKAALLEEALSLFPEEKAIEQDIIYEDDMLMIYTSSE